ncbi:MAG TPA: sigma-70 family RNA polymerase sigma factor [Pyrinomonadaceae bacterium]|nr:sigma-70 family RNA polymerase sigma factor [Pyrinomonadaceae bacterium]
MNNPESKGQAFTEGDRQEFAELYREHHRRVYAICLRMTQNVSDSEDLTQEVFIHLFRTIGSFRGESAFATWLHRLTVNHVLMHFRKRKVRPELTTENGEMPIQVAAGTNDPKRMRVVDRILLSEIIAKLPNGYREAIILHDIEGLEHSEIAQMRGRSVGTSKSQLHKARTMLRTLMAPAARRYQQVDRQSLPSTA